jgi:hypothetical protein
MDYCLISAETLRNLIQCVEAARDSAPAQSLFAMQCEIALERVQESLPAAPLPRVRCVWS